jgi:hypothetical protein
MQDMLSSLQANIQPMIENIYNVYNKDISNFKEQLDKLNEQLADTGSFIDVKMPD